MYCRFLPWRLLIQRSEWAWAFVELRTHAVSLYLLVQVITMDCSEVNVPTGSSWSLPMMSSTLHDLSLTPRLPPCVSFTLHAFWLIFLSFYLLSFQLLLQPHNLLDSPFDPATQDWCHHKLHQAEKHHLQVISLKTSPNLSLPWRLSRFSE